MVFTRAIIVLSLVSLLTDISSEMLYPVMPLYLEKIGFSVVWIGVLEGLAQFAVGLSNGYFSEWSDRLGKRWPFIFSGYSLSTVSKPMMIMMTSLPWVFSVRLLERLGKGIRTGARDAMLVDEAPKGKLGTVFGFHRAMDTIGAAIGPILALIYLFLHPGDYRSLFLFSFFPGVVAVFFLFLIKEKKVEANERKQSFHFFSFLKYWSRSGKDYRIIAGGLILFSLFNSADAFLFLKAEEAGIKDEHIIGAYIGYNLVFALLSYPAGILSDKFGCRSTMITGLLLFACTYVGFALSEKPFVIYAIFALYGLYAAFTEGVSKAWIGQYCHSSDRAIAQGFVKSMTSIMALLSGLFTGLIWTVFSSETALLVSAGGAILTVVFWLFFKPGRGGEYSPMN